MFAADSFVFNRALRLFRKESAMRKTPGRNWPLVVLLGMSFALPSYIVLAPITPAFAQSDSLTALESAFEHPPDDSKIMMRWWWFGPSVTKPELEREMRAMKEGGIGGFEVQPVYPLDLDDPEHGFGNFPFLSDEFIDALRFTSSKARELGLRMDLTLGSGWPYGGPHIPITQAAGRLRCDRVPIPPHTRRIPLPDIAAGEKLLAIFLAPGDPRDFVAGKAREVFDIRDSAVELPADLSGPQVLLFFIASRTGMMVKRPALGAEGFVLDHYDRVAIDHHLEFVGDRMMEAFGPNPPRAVFCDSLEVYGSDWTGSFPEEFRRRRGYDLRPYLPALVGDIGEKTPAIRHDWGETLTELFNDRFLIPLHEWARRNGTLLRAQLYGIPPASVSSNQWADLPEGEGGPRWKRFAPTRWASSANHLYGRPVTSSETWTWLHSPAFRATPLDMKAEADLHFLEGINQLIGHGWPYSPERAGEPGWRFYAAAVFNQHNPWWLVMPDIAAYLQRVSFLLRQGRPVNDVALYLPTDDAWSGFSPGRVSLSEAMDGLLGPNLIPRILEAGYNFDFIDDTAIAQLGTVEKGGLRVSDSHYPVIVLPGVERIPVATLRRLEEFARQGGILIATRRTPSLAPGLVDAEGQSREIRDLSHRLFEGSSAPARLITTEDEQLGPTLAGLLPADVTLSLGAQDIGFVHRSAGFAEIYFLANTSNRPLSAQAAFRVEGMRPEWWDPFTGRVHPAQTLAGLKGATTVRLALEPYGSRVLVFSRRSESHDAVRAPHSPSARLDLSAGWQVSFGDSGQPVEMNRLRSWTDDEGTRFFSGQAQYQKTVNISQELIQPGLEVRLDFGEGTAVPQAIRNAPGMRAWLEGPVREAAVVYVNGKRAGSVWHPPYSVDVTGLLRVGENTFRVVVGNLAINEMAGHALPNYRLLNSRYGERFTPQDMENLDALPSGLLGSIRLITFGAERPLPPQ